MPSPVWRLEGYLKAIWDASANWGTEETLTGEVVSFTGKGSTRIRSLTAELTPVQSGSGTPAPDNARPIAGLTGCTVYVSPTQDPDDASTYDIDWTDEAGTIAGGTLDVTTGLLTVDTVFYTFDGTESGWIASGAYQGSFYRSTGVQHGNSGKCSHAEFTSNFSAYAYGKFALDGVGFVNINVFAQSAGTTVAQFKSWLAAQAANGTPLSFAVSLAAPRTYQLTPQAVAALIGENNVWSDAGNVTVTVKGAQSV